MGSPVGARTKPAGSEEDDVKELSPEEVLRIAGGVPLSAALDELTYRATEEQPGADGDRAPANRCAAAVRLPAH